MPGASVSSFSPSASNGVAAPPLTLNEKSLAGLPGAPMTTLRTVSFGWGVGWPLRYWNWSCLVQPGAVTLTV